MPTNPFLKNLGFAPDDRVVVFHADDVGMCQASIAAFEEMMAVGPLASGAVMVPCPWFREVVAYCQRTPDVDLGVHLTFTSEWDTYRWGPLSTGDWDSGLLDDEGYFYRTTKEAQEHANPNAIQPEVKAQVKRAITAGIDITHIDTHMGTMFHPNFLSAYLEVGRQYRVPLMMLRLTEERMSRWEDKPEFVELLKRMLQEAEEDGFPIIDHIYQMPLQKPEDRLADVTQTLEALAPGLTHFIVHPAKNTVELQTITPDWRGRVADYQTFIHDDLRDYITKSGLQIIDYRTLREAMRPE